MNEAPAITPLAQGGPHLRVSGGLKELVLAPGEEERVEVQLEADTPVPYGAIAPGGITWSLETVFDGRPLAVQAKSALLPVAPLLLPAGTPPTVDGDLRDWDALPFVVERQGDIDSRGATPEDISFRFGVREAGGDVYFGIAVTDDKIDASEHDSPRYQDHARITVDACRPDPERSRNHPLFEAMREGHLELIAHDYMTLAAAREDKVIAFLDDARAAVEWANDPHGSRLQRRSEGLGGVPGRRARRAVGHAANRRYRGRFRPGPRRRASTSAGNRGEWGTAPVAGSGTFARWMRGRSSQAA